MTCKKCGAPLEAGESFCNQCGAPVSRQPTREEVRARVQGGGRHAAPQSRPGSVLIGDLGGALQQRLTPQHTPLLFLAAGLLGILQIVYLLVHTLFVTLGAGQDSLSVESYSMVAALKLGGSTFLAVLLVLLSLALLASFAVPMILRTPSRPLITAGVALLLLILYVAAIFSVKSFFAENFLGVKSKLGFWGFMFLLNCLLIPGLIFVGAQAEDAAPAAAPAPAAPAKAAAPVKTAAPAAGSARPAAPIHRAPAASRRGPVSRPVAPAQKPPKRPGVNGPVRPVAPGRNVTPPDSETIAALRRMAEMHRQGLVSDEEFDRIKAECAARGWIREG